MPVPVSEFPATNAVTSDSSNVISASVARAMAGGSASTGGGCSGSPSCSGGRAASTRSRNSARAAITSLVGPRPAPRDQERFELPGVQFNHMAGLVQAAPVG